MNENQQLKGNGKIVYPNGDIYEGDWIKSDSKPNTTTTNNDTTTDRVSLYEVNENEEMKESTESSSILKRHGKGKLTQINGDMYEGDFENNMKQGYGTETLQIQDGEYNLYILKLAKYSSHVYEGHFEHNVRWQPCV